MTANRKIALGIAIGDYLSEMIDAEKYEEMSIEEFEKTALVWQPFETWEAKVVCEQIESLADNIEKTLNAKDVYPICDKAMKGEIVTDLEENYNYPQDEAEKWAGEHGHKMVDGMWDAYTHYMEEKAVYHN